MINFSSVQLIALIVSGIAVYRLASLIAVDEGPLGIFDRFRRFFGRHAAGEENYGWRKGFAVLISCPYCLGLWIAAIPAALICSSLLTFIVCWFAIAGIQAFLEGLTPQIE